MPATAKANEAFDVTVKALKPDGTTNVTYVGSIFFSVTPTDSGATIPANLDSTDSEFKFSLSDQGQHTFSKAFTFPKEGTYDIIVTDYDNPAADAANDIKKTITITAGGTPPAGTATVTIDQPVAQDTVNASTLVVSGTTKPTSTVNFFVGSDKKGSTITDTAGAFSSTVSGLAE